MSSEAYRARPATLSDLFYPSEGLLRDAILVTGGALFTGLLAQVSIHLPFTPVPITLQTLAVLLLGAGLGAKRGMLSQFLYVLLGAVGLPLYAGGHAGLAELFGPTAGYLFGFIIAGYLTGYLAERQWDRMGRKALVAMILGEICIYACGVIGLGFFFGFGPKLLVIGVLPFVIGDGLKILAASGLLPALWYLGGRR